MKWVVEMNDNKFGDIWQQEKDTLKYLSWQGRMDVIGMHLLVQELQSTDIWKCFSGQESMDALGMSILLSGLQQMDTLKCQNG